MRQLVYTRTSMIRAEVVSCTAVPSLWAQQRHPNRLISHATAAQNASDQNIPGTSRGVCEQGFLRRLLLCPRCIRLETSCVPWNPKISTLSTREKGACIVGCNSFLFRCTGAGVGKHTHGARRCDVMAGAWHAGALPSVIRMFVSAAVHCAQ